ncbi:MAG: YeeE/YedE family protein [Bacteroidetes bacterium]|nr:YeeE/YedE family protein [Bacteroidota bacterium]
MIFFALIIGFVYGYISVKGQFCMNSGFSNVVRKKDTTKLKSFLLAILIQIAVVPLFFTLIYLYAPDNSYIDKIQLPPLFLVGNVVGGFLFGIFMYYAGSCAAGIFYKLGEKKTDTIFAVVGFVSGVYLMEKGFLQGIRQAAQSTVLFDQQPIWKLTSSVTTVIILVVGISLISIGLIYVLLRQEDKQPGGAKWGWKKTGLGLGVSASMAAGCTVGHGLTFTSLLGIGSIVGIVFIFLGSGFIGFLTRK